MWEFKDLIVGTTNTFNTKPEPTVKSIVDLVYSTPNYEQGPWIAGGMGRQLAIGETNFNDIDVWFYNQRQLDLTRTRFTEQYTGQYMYQDYNTVNAETWTVGRFKVQFIKKKFYNSIEEIFNDFDFTCCCVAVDRNLRPYGPGIEHAVNRELHVNRLNKETFLARYAKYVGYGYTMPNEEFLGWVQRTQDISYKFDGSTFDY